MCLALFGVWDRRVGGIDGIFAPVTIARAHAFQTNCRRLTNGRPNDGKDEELRRPTLKKNVDSPGTNYAIQCLETN